MKRKLIFLFIAFIFILMPFVTIPSVMASESFSDVNFQKPHSTYTDAPPSYAVNSSPEQPWKKTDVDFTGSIGNTGEYAIGFSKRLSLKGALPGKLAALEGAVDVSFKIGIRYDITFGYEFGVDYYHWANDMAVSAGQNFTYCTYVEPDPETFSLWADITIEPFMEFSAGFDVYLELAGFEIVDWEKSWSYSLSLPISISPNLDLGALLETGVLTPIGALYSSPKVGLGLELPGRLEYKVGDYAGLYFDAGVGAYVQFQIRGLLESLIQLTGDANAKFDGQKSSLNLRYLDPGKDHIQAITVHVPVGSAGKVVEILSREFQYSIEPGLLFSWDGHLDVGAYLHIPTPTKYIEQAETVTETVCDWLPWPLGYVCEKVTKVVWKFVEVVETIVDDINWHWDYKWEAEGEKWVPFFNIPLLKSSAQALDRITVLQAKETKLAINQNWQHTSNYDWSVDLGPSALNLSAYWGYALNLALKGMLYSYYKPNDQIAGHPFNYYVGIDGDHSETGLLGGWLAAGYSLKLKIPYLNQWVPLMGFDFNSSQFSGLDIPLMETEYSVGVAAISLSSEAKFADLNRLKIAQSASGFLGEWETTPFFTVSVALDGKLFEVLEMNLGSVEIEFLFKGTGSLRGNISASGAGTFPSRQMQWDKSGDINYANIYPYTTAQKGDIINVLLQNLKYNMDLDLVIRVTAKLYAQYGYLQFKYDFRSDIGNLEANVNPNVQDPIKITSGFNPAKITSSPEEIVAGTPFLIKWETSNSTLGQTRLQLGQTPYPKTDYFKATSYKNINSGGLHAFNETLSLNKTGTWYILAYLRSTTPPFDYYSKNVTIKVKPRLLITAIPTNATAGETVTIQWDIFGPASVQSTNLRYSKSPNPAGDPGTGTPIKSGGAGTYSAQIKFTEIGIYYLVAHAQVDNKGTDYYSQIVSIKILPNMTITVLPSPNNASVQFTVKWSIKGAYYIDRTYLQYSRNATFSTGVFSTVSRYGYLQNFQETLALFVKGPWYFRVVASVNGIKDVYYSKTPPNKTQIDPYSKINPAYPRNVTVDQPFTLYWWVFGFNSTVSKTQIFYNNNTNVLNNPLGGTPLKSGPITQFSYTFSISKAGRYYFQANSSVDGEAKAWRSSIISIFAMPQVSITTYPVNATAFTAFNIGYAIKGLSIYSTPVDLWYGETNNIASMQRLSHLVVGGSISGIINLTGKYYFAINLTLEGKQFWSSIISFQIVPFIKVTIPWEGLFTDVDMNKNPLEFGIAGIPLTITWIIRNVTTVNHTDIHFNGAPGYEPQLRHIVSDYYKYEITYDGIPGLMTPALKGTGSHFYVFSVNVTFNVREFTWILFRIHAICDDRPFDYYSNGTGIPVYPVAEPLSYNYTVVVDKQDIGVNPLNFTVTWAMGYVKNPYNAQNTPNAPGYIPYKIIGITHANIHYMLNYDPICPRILSQGLQTNATPVRSGAPLPGIFTDPLTISSVGTYYFRIHVKYSYASTNENFTYPQHINTSYWSPVYQLNVIYYGKYNTTVQVPKIIAPPTPAVSYADYDRDGDLDMLVGKNNGPLKEITLYYNDGTGNYTKIPPKKIISFTSPPWSDIKSLTAAYFDSGPSLDFIMTNETAMGTTVNGYIYLNDGLCNFTVRAQAFNQDSSSQASSYAVGDIDGDGISDYIYYGYSNFRLFYDWGTAIGIPSPGGLFIDTMPVKSLQLVDMDGSPLKDLLIGYVNDSLGLYPNFPTPSPRQFIGNVIATLNENNYPIVADFNKDGFNDSIVVNNTREVILILNITISSVKQVIGYATNMPQGIACGDFEGDGDLDFVIGIGADQFQFFFSNYTLEPSPWPGFSTQIVSNGGNVLATGDFNNDGFIDISAYRGDQYILHYLYGYLPPPTISPIDISYNRMQQTINIENITVLNSEYQEINDTTAYIHLYTILDSDFKVVSPLANLTWDTNSWEALNVDVSYLPESNYYVNVTFGDKYTLGNNSHASTLATRFTIDHYDAIHNIGISYLGNALQRVNITVDLVNSSYTVLGNLTGTEAITHTFYIRNSTGHATPIEGNFTWGSTTRIYRWEAINVSTKSLLPGDYFIIVNFSDYLGYDIVGANSSFFTVDHILFSTTVPQATYEGNLTQMIHIRNINIESSYMSGQLGKGRARIYNYLIYNNGTHSFTGITGKLSYDGFSWFADIEISTLPEGAYYINAFFKDKFNDTVWTANSSAFTIDHILDLSSLTVLYTGSMVQTINITIAPESTWTTRGVLDDTEALNKTYSLYAINGSTPLQTGELTWNGNLWTKMVDVSHLLEGDYIAQVYFADCYAMATQNSTIVSLYHYIGISQPTIVYNPSTFELSISSIIATCSYRGTVNNTNVPPTLKTYMIFASQISGNISGELTYGSNWGRTSISLTSLLYSSAFTLYLEFAVNESFGTTQYEFMITPQKAPSLSLISPNPTDNGTISLDWDDVNGSSVYYIYRSLTTITSVAGMTPLATVTTSAYQDIITGEGEYFYVIIAGNDAGNTTLSNVESVVVDFQGGGGIPGFLSLTNVFGLIVLLIAYLSKIKLSSKKFPFF